MSGVDKLAGIKPGDRVRVTIEGYIRTEGLTGFSIDREPGKGILVNLTSSEMANLVSIERIEPPLKVGDRVLIKGQDAPYEVLRIVGHQAVILTFNGDPFADIYPLSDLERIA